MSKVALVTGGTRGIGAAIAKKLKDEGFKVVSTYVGKEESAQAYSKQSGIEVIKSDVSYFESCKSAVAEVICRNVIEKMRAKGFGRIVSISSINGLKGQVGQTNYSAAKAGIIGFSKALALENANKGITVNVIAPGYVGTDMVKKIDPTILKGIVAQIPAGRLAEPDEIAALASYLVSDKAGFITGATFSINGGQYMQ